MMRLLGSIMAISCSDKISNDEVLKRAALCFLIFILKQMYLQWLGHLEKMDRERLPRQILYSNLQERKRNQERHRLRFKDTVNKTMKKMNIDQSI